MVECFEKANSIEHILINEPEYQEYEKYKKNGFELFNKYFDYCSYDNFLNCLCDNEIIKTEKKYRNVLQRNEWKKIYIRKRCCFFRASDMVKYLHNKEVFFYDCSS